MLLDWIKASVDTIRDKLMGASSAVKVGGFSIIETILKNRENTKRMKQDLIEQAARNDWTPEVLDEQLAVLSKRRRPQTLTTYKNIGVAVRGYARSLLTIGRKGRYYNVTVLDEKTSHVCLGYVGASWPKPYSAIPEKPPRIQRLVHRCRSYLEFSGDEPADTRTFIEQFKDGNDALQEQLLGPVRFRAYKEGRLQINTYAQFERAVLNTIEDLGL